MGYMRHHAIVVTSYKEELILKAWTQARAIFGLDLVSEVLPESIVNGFRSFLIGPDGSKEGWDESNTGDENRARMVQWLDAQRYSDGSTSIEWVEVQYADDEWETKIVHDSDERRRESDRELHPALARTRQLIRERDGK